MEHSARSTNTRRCQNPLEISPKPKSGRRAVHIWTKKQKANLQAAFPAKYLNEENLNKADCLSVLHTFPEARGWAEIKFKFKNLIQSKLLHQRKKAAYVAARAAAKAA